MSLIITIFNRGDKRHYSGVIKNSWQCKAGRERLTPYQSEVHSPTIPTHRINEEKGKTVGDKKGASS